MSLYSLNLIVDFGVRNCARCGTVQDVARTSIGNRKRPASQAALIKTSTYDQNPSGKKGLI